MLPFHVQKIWVIAVFLTECVVGAKSLGGAIKREGSFFSVGAAEALRALRDKVKVMR